MRQGTPNFVGARLRLGREAQGMSATTLAGLLDLNRAAISQYEHGRRSPSPEILRSIADKLNLEPQWFFRPKPDEPESANYFRCLSAATKTARLRAVARLDWLRDVVRYVQGKVRLPPLELPTIDVPADPARIDDDMIEEAATAARRFWKMQDGPISNVVWLLENRGCIVSRFELHAATLDAFSTVDPVSGRPYVILSADKGSASRSRFDAAHELAHILLHRQVPQSVFNQHQKFKLIEDQAHRFANAFLLPATSFAEEFYSHTLDSLRSLKERWRVSIAAMIKRARQLDLISEDEERRLWINMGRRKWRTKEPLDDVLEPERPRFLKRCIEVLIEKRLMSSRELSCLLGIPASDVEKLASLDAGYLAKAQEKISLAHEEQPPEPQEMILRFPAAK